MEEYSVRVDLKTNEVRVLYGRMRLAVALEAGIEPTGIDYRTNKRYRLLLKNGALKAKEIVTH